MKTLIATALTMLAMPAVGANDPDSVGRYVRYLDYAVAKPVITTASGLSCDPALYRCFVTSPAGIGNATVPDMLVLDVGPSFTRSLLCMSTQGHVAYVFRHFATDTIRKKSAIQFHQQLKIESSVLNDVNLINRKTGQPFGGSIETMYTILFDEANLEMAETEQHQQDLSSDCTKGMLSRSILMNEYGLSSYSADRVMRGTLRVTLRINIMNRGVHTSFLEMSARLHSD